MNRTPASTTSRKGTPKRKSTTESTGDMSPEDRKQNRSGSLSWSPIEKIEQRTKKAKAAVQQKPIEIDLEEELLPRTPEVNPIGPGRFFDACVPGGGLFLTPP